MKLFTSEKIRELDTGTIKYEPIASVDLMERAAWQLFKWISDKFGRSVHFVVFAGPGNNGGDGLALARIMAENDYSVEIQYINFTEKTSADWQVNRKRLENVTKVDFSVLSDTDQLPVIPEGDIIIDAIFGSGLTRPVEGLVKDVINYINLSHSKVISIDIPSGLFGEDNGKNSYDTIVRADYTLSFQFPKLSFMFGENAAYTGEWSVLPIGIDSALIRNLDTPYTFLENYDILPLLRIRNKFEHKGNFGHGLLISGSSGKMGAAVLGASAALRSGIGLITCHIPSCGTSVLQCALPEAMVLADRSEMCISDIGNTDIFTAVGVGPGLGTDQYSQNALLKLLSECNKPMVIDADALNIVSLNRKFLALLKPDTILTPHPKEFERLAGSSSDGFQRLKRQIEFSQNFNCIVVLKGANTSVTTPSGSVFFNSTGNPGMATAGSGDVLTGIILSLLSQGYEAANAAITGVYLHGLAGDIAAGESCYESIIASDIINCIGKAFNKIRG